MNKILILIGLLQMICISGFGQIAAWDFFGQNSPVSFAATTYDSHLVTTLDSITRGSGAASSSGANSFRTTGFKNEGISTSNSDYFQFTLTPISGYSLSLSTIDAKFGGTATFYASPGVTSQFAYSLDGTNFTLIGTPVQSTALTMTQIDLTGITALQNVPYGTIVTFRYYASGQTTTGGWGFYSSSAGSNGLSIGGTIVAVNPNNNDSYIQSSTTPVPSGSISSLITTSTMASAVLKTEVVDAGSGDGLPTKITSITIRNNNPVNSADWQTVIQGITVQNGAAPISIQQTTITANNIVLTFLPADLNIPDGGSSELTFSIYFIPSGLIDGSQLQFIIPAVSHGWLTDMSGSAFLTSFGSDVISGIFAIDVQATKIQVLYSPASVWMNNGFTFSATATDINNNVDLNGSQQITIQKTIGSGNLSSISGLTKPLVSGNISWNDLVYDTPGYFSLTLTEQTSSLLPVSSGLINCIPTGQILNESFTDADFSSNPSWNGETGDFIITPELQLQLYTVTTSTDTSFLVTPLWLTLDSIEWQMYLKLGFDPSDNNYTRYYLMSDNENLKSSLSGYFLKFGENGSNDAVELFYQNGTAVTSVCRGTNGQIALSPSVRIKVIRTSAGLWKLYADPTGGSSFELQASGTENSFYPSGFYTGVFCRYTSTNASGKFTFDDFYCGPVQVDTIKPVFSGLSVVDSTHLDLIFSEGISLSTAQLITNYTVNNGIGNPSSVVRDAMDYKLIHLSFSTAFLTGINYTLTVTGLKDFADNSLQIPASENFVWYKAVPFDVQINEILADPSPVVGLPEYEFIELYNRSQYDIDLSGWILTIGTTPIVLPSSKINAQGYLLISTSTAQPFLQSYGQVLGVISSSTALTNTGNSVVLNNKEGELISFIQYSDNWYGSSFKADGGWSLEQKDPLNPCGEDGNWIAAVDASGGTPGRKNSVFQTNTDLIVPEILRASLTLPDTLLITFSETILSDEAISPAGYSVNHGIGQPISAQFTDVLRKRVKLVFNQTFVKDTIYTITLSGQVKDCAGNAITTSDTAVFAIPDSILPGSLVINEILFNPNTGGTDYIELYNNNQKIYDLKDLRLAVLDNTNQPSDLFDITTEGFYMFPGDYAVLSVDQKKVTSFYTCPNKKVFVNLSSMPGYNNSDGRVSFINKSFEIIDDFSYAESMQFQLLNSFQGVSLERIHPDFLTQDKKNWHSASESSGFGTPGYKNSQYSQFQNNDADILIEPEVFSPDNDGRNDILNIRYKFSNPGYVASVTIFDSRGRKVKGLVTSEMLGTEGYFTWDGLNDANQKASIGIYVIYIEIFNLDGKTSRYKKTCVLASHLD